MTQLGWVLSRRRIAGLIVVALLPACGAAHAPPTTVPTSPPTAPSAASVAPSPTAECTRQFDENAARVHAQGYAQLFSPELLAPLEGGPQGVSELVASCDHLDGNACMRAGLLLLTGHGVPADVSRGHALLVRGCTLGQVTSCALYVQTAALSSDRDAALFARVETLVDAACDVGNSDACNAVGIVHMMGDDSLRDVGRALHAFERACEAGGAPACSNAGAMYLVGCTGTPDADRATRLISRACEHDNAAACYMLAQLYGGGGHGIDRDLTRAAEYARRACDLGHAASCAMLGATAGAAPNGPPTGSHTPRATPL